jgi:hypothetical protein
MKTKLLEYGLTEDQAEKLILKVPHDILVGALKRCPFKKKELLRQAIKLQLKFYK